MMNICMIRIDERLIHGQILLKWVRHLNCVRILVIDNETANDPVMSSLLRLSLPVGVELEVCSLNQGISAILNCNESGGVMVLVKELRTIKELWSAGVPLEHVNLARIPFCPGSRKLAAGIYVSPEDEGILFGLLEAGVNIVVQIVPESEPVNAETLL